MERRPEIVAVEPRVLDIESACAVYGMSRWLMDDMRATAGFPAIKVGRRTVHPGEASGRLARRVRREADGRCGVTPAEFLATADLRARSAHPGVGHGAQMAADELGMCAVHLLRLYGVESSLEQRALITTVAALGVGQLRSLVELVIEAQDSPPLSVRGDEIDDLLSVLDEGLDWTLHARLADALNGGGC